MSVLVLETIGEPRTGERSGCVPSASEPVRPPGPHVDSPNASETRQKRSANRPHDAFVSDDYRLIQRLRRPGLSAS